MSFKFKRSQTVYVKSSGLAGVIERGYEAPKRYQVNVRGVLLSIAEDLLSAERPDVHFEPLARFGGCKAQFGNVVYRIDDGATGVVTRIWAYGGEPKIEVMTAKGPYQAKPSEIEILKGGSAFSEKSPKPKHLGTPVKKTGGKFSLEEKTPRVRVPPLTNCTD